MLSKLNPNLQGLQNVNTPDELAQLMLNNGMVRQEQVNYARQMWGQPNIRQMIQQNYKY